MKQQQKHSIRIIRQLKNERAALVEKLTQARLEAIALEDELDDARLRATHPEYFVSVLERLAAGNDTH